MPHEQTIMKYLYYVSDEMASKQTSFVHTHINS